MVNTMEKRTKMCGQFRSDDIGKKVTANGFVAKYRNLGTIFFVDLRDRTGIVQIRFDKTSDEKLFEQCIKLKNEFVISVTGTVSLRGEKNINKNLPTGEIEINAEKLTILSEADVTPFFISDDVNANEALRLKYRYLDLRRPYLQKIFAMRDNISKVARNYLSQNGFMEIETPFLGKSTPEGARDYLVPSRVHPGEFYALPQSPQLFKQLLMIAGFDRYYQIARCFRDEDLRANRQPEFSQIDLEMSFVNDEEDVMEIAEGLIKELFRECLNINFDKPFRRMSYKEAMENYGSDKPDTRFDMKIKDVTNEAKKCAFINFDEVIKNGGKVRAVNAKGLSNTLTRKNIDEICDYAKSCGAKGLYYISLKNEGVSSSISKFLNDEITDSICKIMNAEKGDIIFIAAESKDKFLLETLGLLRCFIAKKYSLIDESLFDILWIKDFPLLEYNEEEQRYVAMHHPFTSPKQEDLKYIDKAPEKIRANAYDLVINGQEAGGGSIRIHDKNMQKKMFDLIGLSEQDIKERFGFFVDAFKYGVPPHGGLAFGLDRLVMLFTGVDNIKDVIAFPKVQNASCLMSEAPSPVEDKQLKELRLSIQNDEQKNG